MTSDLSRLLRPKSVAIVGGGAWCRSVAEQLLKADFQGDIWPVHPRAEDICGLRAYPTALDLPESPDTVFIGINRDATIGVVERLSRMGAGGAVCFASGFGEANDGQDANARLLKAAGDMPILGPNCYGFINAFDGALLWPDQHGCVPVQSGVAILTQSSNIAINLTMQNRGLPVGYMVTCGNQAQINQARIAEALLDDPRVTAIGLHIEGFGDLAAWQRLARKAHRKGIPLVALKVGISTQAREATISHTASLAGSDAGASALLNHLGIARVFDLPTLIETLKLLHCCGPLPSNKIASISCSGGEASLVADMTDHTSLEFPALTETQKNNLSKALGPRVTLANPLDYHTYIWRDADAMTAAFSAMIEPELALTLLIVDFPRSDRCSADDWKCVIEAALRTRQATGGNVAMVSTLPELMPEDVAARLMAGGVVPLNGLAEGLSAAEAAQTRVPSGHAVIVPAPHRETEVLSEFQSKAALSQHGLKVPRQWTGSIEELCRGAEGYTGPFALKSTGLTHKSESGGVALNLPSVHAIKEASRCMPGTEFLLEEMVAGAVAEILIGIVKDPAHGFVLTIAAGGTLTELLKDSTSLLVPTDEERIRKSLSTLKTYPLLTGYRAQPPADLDALVQAILAVQDYVLANLETVEEVEVNPILCTPQAAIAVDALIRTAHDRSS